MIWYKDLSNFITADNYHEFFPSSHMSIEEQMNSIVRFSLYLSIILILLKQNLQYIYIVITAMVFSYFFMYYVPSSKKQHFKPKFVPPKSESSTSKQEISPREQLINSNDLYNPDFSEKVIHNVPDANDEYLEYLYGKK